MVFSAFWMFVSITLTEQELAAVNGWIAATGRHSIVRNRRARITTKQPASPPPPPLFRSLSLCDDDDDDDDDDMSFRAAPAADVASTTSPSSPERRASSSSPPQPLRRGRRGPLRFSSSVTASATAAAAQERQDRAVSASPRRAEALRDPTLFTPTSFDNSSGSGGGVTNLHPATVRAVTEVLGWRQLTTVQARTWPVVWNGTSAAVRAATGTGKTAAFLVPAIERLYGNRRHSCAVSRKESKNVNRNHSKNNKVRVLIVAPTRELAQQITDEAEKLVTFHYQKQVVMCLTGGTKLHTDLRRLSRKTGGVVPDIVVATPGRLLDHLQSDRRLKGGVTFQQLFAETEILVLDEADRLVDAFGAEMKRVLSYLPRPEKRQTLLFSATMMHDRIRSRMDPVLRRQLLPADYAEIDCLLPGNNTSESSIVEHRTAATTRSESASASATAQTTKKNQTMPSRSSHRRVDQSYAVLSSMDSYLPTLVALVAKNLVHREKAMVFLPTAKLVKFVHEFFVLGMELDDNSIRNHVLLAMHSRMSQASRNRISRRFRAANAGVLLTTDLSARGMDYPDVDLVIQYGAPCNREMYVHRLGRTGRAGREGAGLLVLLPFETTSWFLAETKKRGGSEKKELAAAALRRRDDIMPLPPPLPLHNSCANNSSSGSSSLIDNSQQEDQYDKMLRHAVQLIRNGHPVLTASAVAAYQSMIAYYLEQPAFSVRRGKKQQQQQQRRLRRHGRQQQQQQHRSRSHEELLKYANAFLRSAGVVKIPQLSETLAKKIIIRKQKT